MESPKSIKEVQKLTGRVAALNRFIYRSSERCRLFYDVLRKNKGFEWTERHEVALTQLKQYLSNALLLSKPVPGEELFVNLSITSHAVSGILVREEAGVQSPIYHVSRSLLDAETMYSSLEKLILFIEMTSIKLRHYFQSHKICVKMNYPLKTVLSRPELTGRMAKWSIRLSMYDIMYDTRTLIKSRH